MENLSPICLGRVLAVLVGPFLSFCPPHSQGPATLQKAFPDRLHLLCVCCAFVMCCGVVWQFVTQRTQCFSLPEHRSDQLSPHHGLTSNQCGLQSNPALLCWEPVATLLQMQPRAVSLLLS